MDDPRTQPLDDPPGQLASKVLRPTLPPTLEARVSDALADVGLLRPRRSRTDRWIRVLTAAAACVGFFLAGRWTSRPVEATHGTSITSGSTPRWVLLLYGKQNGASTANDVEEHRAWARALAAGGHDITGEKLSPTELTLAPGGAASHGGGNAPALEGFFVISARDESEALEIARSSPHYRHGGQVVIRHIDPT
jgi:hypothetical protein